MLLQKLSAVLKMAPSCVPRGSGLTRAFSSESMRPAAVGMKAHGIDKHGIEPPFTYQKDVTLNNIQEILQTITRDTTYGNNMYNSETIIKAVTAIADRPWWTCRDANNTMVGFYCITRDIGERCVCGNTLYVAPEARGHGIAAALYGKCLEAMNQEPKLHFRGWYSPGGAGVAKTVHDCHPNEEKDLSIRYGVPKYDPAMLQEPNQQRYRTIPFSRENLFDKLVTWDAARVYDVPRPAFWNIFLDSAQVHSYVAIENTSEDIVGFGAVQPALDKGCMIMAPLYAEDDDVAMSIMRHLLRQCRPEQRIIATQYKNNKLMKEFFDSIEVPHFLDCPLLSSEPDTFPEELTKRVFLSPSNSLCMQ